MTDQPCRPTLRHAVTRGFTLVEILIVVVILSVLAAIAIPQFNSSTEDAKLSALDTDLASHQPHQLPCDGEPQTHF